MLIAVMGSAATFVAVAAVLVWAGQLRGAPAEARISRLARPRTNQMEAPFSDRVVVPVFSGLARTLVELLPHAFVKRINAQLVAAGSPMSTQAFFTLALMMGLLLPAGAFAFLASSGANAAIAVIVALFFAAFGSLTPFLWLKRRVRRRKMAIWKSLADAFDLITVSVEAGLGLDAALRQVAERLRGPLGDEIGRTLREIGMGRPRREALEDMATRVDVKELGTFVNAVIQAEQLGTSLGRVLRAQGTSLRIKRRQRAEEMARRAPVKMVFPLVFFIMPTFFVVALGPMAIRLVEYIRE